MTDGPRSTSRLRGWALPVLARRWLVVVMIPLIAGGTVYAMEADNQERHRSTAKVLLQPTDLGAALAGVPDLGGDDPERTIATETEIASVPQVRAAAEEELGVTGSAVAQRADFSFSASRSFSSGDSDVFNVAVVADEPIFAQEMATATAREYIRFRTELSNREIAQALDRVRERIGQLRRTGGSSIELGNLVDREDNLESLLLLGSGRARLLAEGDTPVQVAPTPLRRAGVAGGLGLVVAILLAFLMDRLDRRARSEDEIAERLAAPLIGRLPDPRRLGAGQTVVALSSPQAAETEAFRLLRANLRFSLLGRDGHSVGITSASEGEGKSFVASNLAVVAAAAGARVALVDLDLRRPALHRYFGHERTPGFADVVTGMVGLDEALIPIELPDDAIGGGARGSLHLLTAGRQAPNPGELAASVTLHSVMRELEDRFDLVVADTPPTLAVNDAVPIASTVSGMLAVVRLPEARRPELGALRDSLGGGSGIMGVVLTAAWRGRSSYYAYREPNVRAER